MNYDSSFDDLVKGGLIGATLGAFLSADKEDGIVIGSLLGAALFSTKRASEKARKLNVRLLVEEDGKLYEVIGESEKRFIRIIKKPSTRFPSTFKLK